VADAVVAQLRAAPDINACQLLIDLYQMDQAMYCKVYNLFIKCIAKLILTHAECLGAGAAPPTAAGNCTSVPVCDTTRSTCSAADAAYSTGTPASRVTSIRCNLNTLHSLFLVEEGRKDNIFLFIQETVCKERLS